jgi:putative addiction module killer protein
MKHTAWRYSTLDGKEPFSLWFKGLKDVKAKAMILKRIERLESGNFGVCKPCRDGVFELIIDFGPGYRVYFGKIGKNLILLFCAGEKSTQQTDIDKAVAYLKDFKERAK